MKFLFMNDHTASYLPLLKNHKIASLDLGPEAIHPAYEGHSLLNLPASLTRWLEAPALEHPALDIPPLDEHVRDALQIVLVLIDAVSFDRFRSWIQEFVSDHPSLFDGTILLPITSVAPSTTSNVLTTLWTGRSPAEHGILGYELFLKEYGMVANMITHSPAAMEGGAGLLYRAGFQPENELPVATLGPHFAKAGVEVTAFLANNIINSGLSRMHYPSVNLIGYRTVSDLWILVRRWAESKLASPRLIWVYYGAVDGISHTYGPDSEQAHSEFSTFLGTMIDSFVLKLDQKTRRQTLLLLLSDHGQIGTPSNPHFDLASHKTLLDRLHILPTGENRFVYLHPRPGQVEAVLEYIEQTWLHAFRNLHSGHALDAGLFGPGKPAGAARSRIGERIVLPQGNAYLWWAAKPDPLRGRHGGLSPEEMLVPLMAMRMG
jgi:hypothetical protein